MSLVRAAFVVLTTLHGASAVGANKIRIASLNLCTDSMLFELAEPEQIVSVTSLSRDAELSHFSELAQKLPINRGLAEEVIALDPDLVLTGSYTATGTSALLSKLGYNVMTFQPALDLQAFRESFLRLGESIGTHGKAVRLLAEMDQKIANITHAKPEQRPRAVIYRPNGFSLGRRSLANEMLKVAGIRNLADEFDIEFGGFVPLERLVITKPDIIILPDRPEQFPALADMILAHPALRFSDPRVHVEAQTRRFKMSEKYWACGGTFIADAAAILAESIAQ